MKLKHLVAVAALVVPFAATADISYKYAEFSYLVGSGTLEFAIDDDSTLAAPDTIGSGDSDFEGFDVRLMMQVSDDWLVSLRTADMEIEGGGNFTDTFFGGGYKVDLGSAVDLYGLMGYMRSEVPFYANGIGTGSGGFGVDLGGIVSIVDVVEIGVHVAYNTESSEAFENAVNYGLSTSVNLGKNLAIVGRYEVFDYTDGTYTVVDTNGAPAPGNVTQITNFDAEFLSVGVRMRF